MGISDGGSNNISTESSATLRDKHNGEGGTDISVPQAINGNYSHLFPIPCCSELPEDLPSKEISQRDATYPKRSIKFGDMAHLASALDLSGLLLTLSCVEVIPGMQSTY